MPSKFDQFLDCLRCLADEKSSGYNRRYSANYAIMLFDSPKVRLELEKREEWSTECFNFKKELEFAFESFDGYTEFDSDKLDRQEVQYFLDYLTDDQYLKSDIAQNRQFSDAETSLILKDKILVKRLELLKRLKVESGIVIFDGFELDNLNESIVEHVINLLTYWPCKIPTHLKVRADRVKKAPKTILEFFEQLDTAIKELG